MPKKKPTSTGATKTIVECETPDYSRRSTRSMKNKLNDSEHMVRASTSAAETELSLFRDSSEHRPDFKSMKWTPVTTIPGSVAKESVTISLPFAGVCVEDIPDVLECFGGPNQIISNLTNPRENQRKLVFDLCPDPIASHAFSRPMPLARSSPTNTFVLHLELEEVVESDEKKAVRRRKELSAVERELGAALKPLPARILTATLTHRITTLFEFNQLYDFRVCPSAPKDKLSSAPETVELTSLIPYIRPTFPMSGTASDPQAELYFPALRFTNQTGFGGLDFIGSIYTAPVPADDKPAPRARRAFAQTVRWPQNGTLPVVPTAAAHKAKKNLDDRVSVNIIEQAKSLFAVQPIWSRQEFYEQLEKDCPELVKEHCRFILPGLAFRFSNGPWTRSWCRFGYDPTRHPESRKLQLLDFRINQAIIAKRRTISKKAPPTELNLAMRSLMEKLADAQNPHGYQFLIQLVRLQDVYNVQEIMENRQYWSDRCDPKEGFFVKGTMERLRLELTHAIAKQDPGLSHLRRVVKGLQEIGLYDKVDIPRLRLGDSDDEGNDDAAQD
ncbi:general transcription factor 3C polypeptide 5-like [Paramacrobiotus metropolitanus]|uniref:general transcription factor 3C polypeptide 5-like n=1 Tax=Paramacrobiotus metropolitanus TaxID=2943436 RepID=UPI002445A252|nr:general transcription factor 3C polypeptide 5-like [Paramacrobiotus metropolitanus]